MLAVAALSLFSIYKEYQRNLQDVKEQAAALTQSLSDVLGHQKGGMNQQNLESILKVYLTHKRIVKADFIDKSGKVLVSVSESSAIPFELPLHEKKLIPHVWSNDTQIDILHPVFGENHTYLGQLHISYNNDEIQENMAIQMQDMLLAFLACLILAIIATFTFSSRIIKPLRELTDKANRIIQGEKIPLTLNRQDEIGSLALSLNTMIRSINTRDEKLRILTSSLEEKVKQRTHELAEALKKAESATEAKATFLASMTHELRTPMNGVIGTACLLADTPLEKDQKEKLDIITNCGNHLLTVINDILDFSKIEAAKMDLDFAPLSLEKIINESIDIVKPQLARKSLELTYSIDPDTPLYIEGDAVRLRQILVNLISNALKFTMTGGVYISVCKENKDKIKFTVRDTGIGIKDEVKETLFQAFTQADSSVARKFGGTGLGLVICKRLVELMGGKISVKSKLGQGSSFIFTIKAKILKEITQPVETEKNEDLSALGREKPMRILLAEDNLVNQMVAKGFLNKLGYEPDVAANGREVIQAIQVNDYDLIFMDMMMPEMDGLEATKIICSLKPPHQRPWIVAMTANTLNEHKKQCIDAGMNDFLTKPFTLITLEAALNKAPCAYHNNKNTQVNQKPIENQKTEKNISYSLSIQKNKIFEFFKDDVDLIPFAIEAFMKDYPIRMEKMEASLENDNYEELAIAAHTLRGAVSNFHAQDAVKYSSEIEQSAKRNDLLTAKENFSKLKVSMEKVHADLDVFLKELKA
ncbi:MAG: response regulator [Alphaproteobacteria bacterium]|nr:response regulator [Alphaproteobacteria bacterium]